MQRSKECPMFNKMHWTIDLDQLFGAESALSFNYPLVGAFFINWFG